MTEIIVRKIPLPVHVRAFTMPDPQGDYNIYINSALSEEQQRRSLLHELRHIRRDDFFRKDASARQLEAETRSSRD